MILTDIFDPQRNLSKNYRYPCFLLDFKIDKLYAGCGFSIKLTCEFMQHRLKRKLAELICFDEEKLRSFPHCYLVKGYRLGSDMALRKQLSLSGFIILVKNLEFCIDFIKIMLKPCKLDIK